MRNIFVVLSLICCLNPCLTWAADNKPLENTEFQVFKTQTELKLDALKENQAKAITEATKSYIEDLNKQNVIISAQDKRIGDLNLYLAIYAVIGGLLGVFVAIAAYLSAGSKARQEATQSSENWFNQNEKGLLSRLKILEDSVSAKAMQAHNAIHATEQSVIEKGAETAQRMLVNSGSSIKVVSVEDKTNLNAADNVLKDKPESQFTFSDWSTRASASDANNNFALAADFWEKAAQTKGATDDQVIMALNNKGSKLRQINQPEQALSIFDDLIKRYSNSQNPVVRVMLAVVMANKGAVLLKQAKQAWMNTAQRHQLLQKALAMFTNAESKLHILEEHYFAVLGDIAYAQWLLGNKGEAAVRLTKALNMGGETEHDNLLDGAARSTVDADAGFVELVNKLWDEQLAKKALNK